MKSKIAPANLIWDERGNPLSNHFEDPYFSRDNGLAESNYVFLEANDLPNRFARLQPGQNFVIGETGFGTGLNFLLTWRCFKQHAPANARLTYISIEGYPLRLDDLQRAANQWPELKIYSDQLADLYPLLVPGHHWRRCDEQLSLHLIFDQIEPALQSLHPKITHHNWQHELPRTVDAWFLDGFAPAKNPEMWQQAIYPSIARLSTAGTSLSSFTAAGTVRRSLQEWGFSIEKIPGYGRKREMIRAEFNPHWIPEKSQIQAHSDKDTQTWHIPAKQSEKPQQVTLLGAGIAAMTLALSLAKRGVRVQILDRHKKPFSGASGNPQVAIFGRLSPDNGDLEDFVLQSLAYAAAFYAGFWQQQCGDNCGLLQLARTPNEVEKMQRLINQLPENNGLVEWIEAGHSKDVCGLELPSAGLWFPRSGWVSPPLLAEQILQHPLIEFTGGQELTPVYKQGLWHLQDIQGESLHRCETLVICSGFEAKNHPLLDWLPIKAVAGQLELVKVNDQSQHLNSIVSQYTSILPAHNKLLSLGGSYRLGESSLDIREEDTQANLDKVRRMLGCDMDLTTSYSYSRTGVRATTPDYLPICGPATDLDGLKLDFAALRKDAKTPIHRTAPALPGLFLNLGYGSRGYAYAPLCAEHLTSLILGEDSPLPNHLQRSLLPARFPIRDMIRARL